MDKKSEDEMYKDSERLKNRLVRVWTGYKFETKKLEVPKDMEEHKKMSEAMGKILNKFFKKNEKDNQRTV